MKKYFKYLSIAFLHLSIFVISFSISFTHVEEDEDRLLMITEIEFDDYNPDLHRISESEFLLAGIDTDDDHIGLVVIYNIDQTFDTLSVFPVNEDEEESYLFSFIADQKLYFITKLLYDDEIHKVKLRSIDLETEKIITDKVILSYPKEEEIGDEDYENSRIQYLFSENKQFFTIYYYTYVDDKYRSTSVNTYNFDGKKKSSIRDEMKLYKNSSQNLYSYDHYLSDEGIIYGIANHYDEGYRNNKLIIWDLNGNDKLVVDLPKQFKGHNDYYIKHLKIKKIDNEVIFAASFGLKEYYGFGILKLNHDLSQVIESNFIEINDELYEKMKPISGDEKLYINDIFKYKSNYIVAIEQLVAGYNNSSITVTYCGAAMFISFNEKLKENWFDGLEDRSIWMNKGYYPSSAKLKYWKSGMQPSISEKALNVFLKDSEPESGYYYLSMNPKNGKILGNQMLFEIDFEMSIKSDIYMANNKELIFLSILDKEEIKFYHIKLIN